MSEQQPEGDYVRPSQPLRDAHAEALNRRLPWWGRVKAWLMARLTLPGDSSPGTAGGYWGGITMWDLAKALGARARHAAATAFLRR